MTEDKSDLQSAGKGGAPTAGQAFIAIIVFFLAALAIIYWLRQPSAEQKLIKVAEERLEFLEANNGSADEICDAHRAVQHAYEQIRDADGYQLAKVTADINCRRAAMDRQLGL